MGVDGFWPIVSSRGKLVSLEVLSDKVLAIDASIWIYQFAHAMKESSTGEQVKASHIIGFFKRICKLLFLRVKPVFVFDGPPIPLKFACLKKRHDETVPDSMFRKAAAQLLLRNLQSMNKTGPSVHAPADPDPVSSDIDEIHVLTDSDSSDQSPTTRLRLTVPEEFRGFMSSRRTLDCVALPVSPEKQKEISHRDEIHKQRDWGLDGVDMAIDEETLKDLPLHEQYRGLLQARSAMLSHGRRKALHMASSSSSVKFTDLQALSTEQIKAVFELAKVTDMAKAVRLKMAQENDDRKDEYIPPDDVGRPPSAGNLPFKKRKRTKLQQWYLEGESGDQKHSVLQTARTVKREQLLFTGDDEKVVDFVKPVSPQISDDGSVKSESDLKNALFGDDWADIADTKPPEGVPVPVKSEVADSAGYVRDHDLDAIDPSPASRTERIELDQPDVSPPRPGDSETEVSESTPAPNTMSLSEMVQSDPTSDIHPLPASPESEKLSMPVIVEPDVPLVSEPDLIDSEQTSDVNDPIPTPDSPGSSTSEHVVETDSEHEEPLRDPVVSPPFIDEFADMPGASLEAFLADLETPFLEESPFQPWASVAEPEGDAYEEIQQLLTAFGIPWVSSPGDAEAQCAVLSTKGLVDGVISDDSDTLIYGAPVVFRHLYLGDSTVEIYRRDSLGFSLEELISLAMLLGCDFTEGVRGIGPVNATEIVRLYPGMDGLGRFRTWADRTGNDIHAEPDDSPEMVAFKQTHAKYRHMWAFPENFPQQEVWDVFADPAVDPSEEPFSWAEPDPQQVMHVVTSLSGMPAHQVESLLTVTLAKYREARMQRRITDYFAPAFQRGQVSEVVSKRLKAALG